MSDSPLRIGIVTVSDRASRGEYDDRGGPAVHDWLQRALITPWEADAQVVPDEPERLKAVLESLCDDLGCALVITTGGTGPAPRDVTVDVTLAVGEKELPGFGERMRAVSVKKVATAILSRQTAVIRGRSLILNLPGSVKGVAECLEAVFAAVPDCIDLIGGPRIETNPAVVQAYRPHS
ncbi:molybdopterin adenylyltransferase [Endothiovibrio diazotrophicus]